MRAADAISAYRLDGVAICAGLVNGETQRELLAEFDRLSALTSSSHRAGSVYGIRGLLRKSPLIAGHAREGSLPGLARQLIGRDAIPIRGIFFDKTRDANWPLPWHQDRTAALRAAYPPAEFRNWTVKDGATHAELPLDYLRAMVTLRVHLDPCDAETGALLVLIGHHNGGVMSNSRVRALAASCPPRTLAVNAGDTVILSPLTPHSSRRTTRLSRRRVLHIEYCAKALPEGVEWLEAT